jgi:transcriptional regulator with XRE-family HTH domain
MTINGPKDRLIEALKNKEYRHAFAAAHITNGIAFQIRALREQREWNQERLAKEAEMKQERISVLENPNHSSVNIETLKRLAKAFDVALIVRFVPFIQGLAEWELNLSAKSLEALSFEKELENYIKETTAQSAATDDLTLKERQALGGNVIQHDFGYLRNRKASSKEQAERQGLYTEDPPQPSQGEANEALVR